MALTGSERTKRWRKRHPEQARKLNVGPGPRHRWRVRDAKRKGHAPPIDTEREHPKPTDGRCECCGEPDDRLCFDHDHKTGEFLGWCCTRCNLLGENIDRLQMRIAYLLARVKSR
jgi:hypothetical protein